MLAGGMTRTALTLRSATRIDGIGESTAPDPGVSASPETGAPAPLRPSITCRKTWPVIESGMNIANPLALIGIFEPELIHAWLADLRQRSPTHPR
jgi:hypothetical protein